jgi:hypothetical protein
MALTNRYKLSRWVVSDFCLSVDDSCFVALPSDVFVCFCNDVKIEKNKQTNTSHFREQLHGRMNECLTTVRPRAAARGAGAQRARLRRARHRVRQVRGSNRGVRGVGGRGGFLLTRSHRLLFRCVAQDADEFGTNDTR